MRIENRRARFEYEVLETLEAGIALSGAEVKSVKGGRMDLSAAYVVIRQNEETEFPEAWLLNALIPTYAQARGEDDPKRTRKLLLHRRELFRLEQKVKQDRLTIVPLAVYTTGRLIKLSVGLARGRRMWQKRDLLRKRDLMREEEKELAEK